MWGHIRLKKCCIQVCQVHDKVIFVVYRDGVGGSMKKIVTVLAGAILTLGLAGCGASETTTPIPASSEVTSTTSEAASTTASSEAPTTSSETTTQPVATQPIAEETYVEPAPVVEETYVAPQRPPFMDPEDFDPYGPPKFVQCWENNAAVMSDGSIVTDTVNCALDPAPSEVGPYGGPPRADGCVGPAAVCGYYDEYGNPIWFDKMTGETSPRYYDEYGNPTMESY